MNTNAIYCTIIGMGLPCFSALMIAKEHIGAGAVVLGCFLLLGAASANE